MASLILLGTDNIFQMSQCTEYSNTFPQLGIGKQILFHNLLPLWNYLVPYIYFAVDINETAIWNKAQRLS